MRIGNKQITTAHVGRFVAGTTLALALAAPSTAFAAPVRLWVDAGHGGKDPGAVSGGLLEKDSALSISKMVAESAKRQGWEVGMSRTDDTFVQLRQRPARANAFKADALVSIHSNSAGSKPTGNMTIHRGGAGEKLGGNIMGELDKLTPYEDIGNRSDVRGLAVLRGAKVPAVIVELLSVSNAPERTQLKDPAKQREMAEAVVRGVAKNEGVNYVPPVASPKKAETAEPKAAADAKTAKPKAAKAVSPAVASKAQPKPEVATQAPSAKPAVAEKATETVKANESDTFGLKALWRILFG